MGPTGSPDGGEVAPPQQAQVTAPDGRVRVLGSLTLAELKELVIEWRDRRHLAFTGNHFSATLALAGWSMLLIGIVLRVIAARGRSHQPE